MHNTLNKAIIQSNNKLRLQALDYFDMLKDLPDRYFSNLAQIISLRVKSVFQRQSWNAGTNSVEREKILCYLAILESEPTVFTDSLKEPCLLSNPLLIEDFGLRFYTGAPIISKEGFDIGTVCIVAKEPRIFSTQEMYIITGDK